MTFIVLRRLYLRQGGEIDLESMECSTCCIFDFMDVKEEINAVEPGSQILKILAQLINE
jgi:hypothetical protein